MMVSPTPPSSWTPRIHAERRPMLLVRGAIVRALRDLFAELAFVEVETPALQVSPGNEIHLQAFGTELAHADRRDRRYLRTSPEFACKKLMAAGERRIVEFARVFRNGERSALHHPEFTMLEWYRAGESYETIMDDCIAVIAQAASTPGCGQFAWREHAADPFARPERLTVPQAVANHARIDPLA